MNKAIADWLRAKDCRSFAVVRLGHGFTAMACEMGREVVRVGSIDPDVAVKGLERELCGES
jgi:hypothetical protein